jgi:hypothetical protein
MRLDQPSGQMLNLSMTVLQFAVALANRIFGARDHSELARKQELARGATAPRPDSRSKNL